MFTCQTSVLHQSSKNRSDYVAACRFFNNPKVNHSNVGQSIVEQTAAASGGKAVIVIQDTTSVNFAAHAEYLDIDDKDLGPVGSEGGIGFMIHPCIVIDEISKTLLGASDIHIWNRSLDKPNKHKRQYAALPIHQKESSRWIDCAQRSKKVLSKAASILFIADREADIYEEFAQIPDDRCSVLIRCKENRLLYDSEQKLYEAIASQPPAGTINVHIREANKRKSRDATLSVKYCKVKIAKPKNHPHKDTIPDYIELYGIEVKETAESVPKGSKPICWILLTDCPIASLFDALYLVECYALRWQVELIFGTLKTNGLDIEESELESGRALKSMAAMSLITALRVNQLRLTRDNTSLPAKILFTPSQIALLYSLIKTLEGQTERQKNQYPPETAAWGVWAIARLGGWKGYSKSESPPGNKTMHVGWNAFNHIHQGWALINE